MRLPLALLALLAACGTTPNRSLQPGSAPAGSGPGARSVSPAPATAEPAVPAEPDGPDEPEGGSAPRARPDAGAVVVRVAGQPILVSELLGAWLHRDSREVRAYLEELILGRVVMLEAGRLGVVLPDSALDEAMAEANERLKQEVARAGGVASVEEFLARRLGLEPAHYRQVLREQTAIDLYAARVVRAWMLGSERAEVRVIVTDSQQAVTAARAALDGGEEFAAVCARYSQETSAAEGGRVPPVVRGPTAMARLAFSTPIGAVGGPVFEGGRWMLLRVDDRPEPASGEWSALGPAVEASLAALPIEDPEYWQWKGWVLGRYEVDMQPLLELTDGALLD